jgi:hypothetical protein
MSQTTNYGLYTEDDATTKFLTWRQKMNGTAETSNMQIIDRVLGEKADSSTQVTGVLRANAWSGVDAPFTQTVSVTGLKVGQAGDINVSQSATFEQRQVAREAMLAVTGQAAGQLTISADGEMPDLDIPFVVTLLG